VDKGKKDTSVTRGEKTVRGSRNKHSLGFGAAKNGAAHVRREECDVKKKEEKGYVTRGNGGVEGGLPWLSGPLSHVKSVGTVRTSNKTTKRGRRKEINLTWTTRGETTQRRNKLKNLSPNRGKKRKKPNCGIGTTREKFSTILRGRGNTCQKPSRAGVPRTKYLKGKSRGSSCVTGTFFGV